MLRKAHRQLFAQNNLIISVVGDIEETDLLSQIDKIFAELPLQNTTQQVGPFVPLDGNFVFFEFPGPQTDIIFGHIGISFDDPDYYAALVVNHILGGGGFSARLMTEIREKRGLVYSVYSYLSETGSLPVWMGRMGTSHKNVEEALSVLRTELKRMREDGPSETELENAKNYIEGSYALGFDSGKKIASKMLTAQFFDLSPSHFEKRNNYIKAVTLDDAKRVARRLLRLDQLVITTVGQRKASE
jgi:zinc protease